MPFSLEASPSDRILRSGLPECSVKRALSPVTGPREAQGQRDPHLLFLGTAISSDLVRLSKGPPMSVRTDSLPAPLLGKEAKWGNASAEAVTP